ncbi:hypothetical protein B0H99_101373 [Planomicrobium soli]|uniref:Uncharacterized protein n=1 Tax=Planomicrobium soli TaxID=1176648 RepID=A0A2P8H7A8_9BACL|nr:hypothetical protein [Planomicrobium soli]PSL42125.1 hypothetical protein B0H99_101373 [Planomicrobium soli]
MRELSWKDVFAVSRILKKMQIRFEYKEGMTMEQMGTAFFQAFIENIGEAETEVTKFFADLKGVKPAVIEKYTMKETLELIKELKEMPDLQSFFSLVSESMNQQP